MDLNTISYIKIPWYSCHHSISLSL